MTDLWIDGQDFDPIYMHYRDSSHNHASMVRDELQRWWKDAKPYLDRNFPKQLCQEPYSRFWELRLATLLLENSKYLVPMSERGTGDAGPDFLIEDDNGKIWVEAVALTLGEEGNPDRVPDIVPGKTSLVPNPQIELRISSVISDKIKIFNRYIEKGIVEKKDRTLIAVNTGNLPHRNIEDRGTPLCVLYPIGDLQYSFNKFDEGGNASYQSRYQIQKTHGAPVDTDYFSIIENQHITGVLWSTFSVSDYSFPSYDICYFPNPLAINPLGKKWLNWTHEWDYDVNGYTVDINKINYHRRVGDVI